MSNIDEKHKNLFDFVKKQIITYFKPLKRCIDINDIKIIKKRGRPSNSQEKSYTISVKDELGNYILLEAEDAYYFSDALNDALNLKIYNSCKKTIYNHTTYVKRGMYVQSIKNCVKPENVPNIKINNLNDDELKITCNNLIHHQKIAVLERRKQKVDAKFEKFKSKYLQNINNKIHSLKN